MNYSPIPTSVINLTSNIVTVNRSNNIVSTTQLTSLLGSNGQYYIISLEDGKTFKSFKRHPHSTTTRPKKYRTGWQTEEDNPLIASDYSGIHSKHARKMNLVGKS